MTHQPHPVATSPATTLNPLQIRDAVRRILDDPELPAIVQAGHPVLRQLAAPVFGQIDDSDLSLLIERMRDVMRAAPGVGLAAPQLGVPLQLAVLEDKFEVDPVSAAARDRQSLEFFAMINPGYRGIGTGTASFYEGCLSVSGYQAVVTRHRDVELRYFTPDGHAAEAWYSGWQARIVQHETDHLQGTLYLDRAELRSLAGNAEYAEYWAHATPDDARRGLGFLRD
ncbi:peptide deformylase [Paenarthrobacter sp. NPDC092416]|uniref:peptide deformylase n=1 Tax=Paenarthrobacter sp. NPDC092416 TaxID=3364386 RepID=UPI0037F5AC54